MKKLVSLFLALAMVLTIGLVSAVAESDAPHIVIYMNNGAFSVATGSDKSMYTDMQNYILAKTGVLVDIIQPRRAPKARSSLCCWPAAISWMPGSAAGWTTPRMA